MMYRFLDSVVLSIVRRKAVFLAMSFVLAASFVPGAASAQRMLSAKESEFVLEMTKRWAEMMARSIKLRAVDTVRVDVLGLSSSDSSVVINLHNISPDTVYVAFTLQYAPLRPAIDPMLELLAADSIEAAEKGVKAHYDSLEKKFSLASRVQDLPVGLWMLPGERRPLRLRLDVPSGLSAGEYSVHVVGTTVLVRPPRLRGELEADARTWDLNAASWLEEYRKQIGSRAVSLYYAQSAGRITHIKK